MFSKSLLWMNLYYFFFTKNIWFDLINWKSETLWIYFIYLNKILIQSYFNGFGLNVVTAKRHRKKKRAGWWLIYSSKKRHNESTNVEFTLIDLKILHQHKDHNFGKMPSSTYSCSSTTFSGSSSYRSFSRFLVRDT